MSELYAGAKIKIIGWIDSSDRWLAAKPYWIKASLWIALMLWTFILIVSTSLDVLNRYAEYKNHLYPLPPKGEMKKQYAQDEAVPKEIKAVKFNTETEAKAESQQAKKESPDLQYAAAVAEFVKNKRDLNAQEGMWRAANLLVVLTLAQVFVGAITAYFLVMAFRTQKEELGAAHEAALAAIDSNNFQKRNNSPILYFTANVIPPDKSMVKGQYQININFGNGANSPATDVFMNAFLVSKQAFTEGSFELVSNGQPLAVGSIAGYDMENAFQIIFKKNIPLIGRDFKKLYVVVTGTYRTLFEPEKDHVFARCERIIPFDIKQISLENTMRNKIKSGEEAPPVAAAPRTSLPTNFENFRGQMVGVGVRNDLIAFCEGQKIGGALIPLVDEG